MRFRWSLSLNDAIFAAMLQSSTHWKLNWNEVKLLSGKFYASMESMNSSNWGTYVNGEIRYMESAVTPER